MVLVVDMVLAGIIAILLQVEIVIVVIPGVCRHICGMYCDTDSVYLADDSERYPARAQLPVPDKPPYTAHVANLSFEVTEGEISEFFASCNVSSVRLVRDRVEDRPKGFGYVEFNTKDGLVAALDLNGTQLAGRPVRINVADPRKLLTVVRLMLVLLMV